MNEIKGDVLNGAPSRESMEKIKEREQQPLAKEQLTKSNPNLNVSPVNYKDDQQVKRMCIVNRLSPELQNKTPQEDIIAVAKAIQKALYGEFLHYYGYTGKLYYCPPNVKEPDNMWNMYLLDSSDIAGALGYHDANSKGIPQSKTFLKTAEKFGTNWSVTLSHEIYEALTDPWGMANYFQSFTNGIKRLVANENCDPVEADKYSYKVNGIPLTNFITPYWLHPFNDTAEADNLLRYDLLGLLNKSFQHLPGCHQSYYYIQDHLGKHTGWIDQNFQKAPEENLSELKENYFEDKYNLGDEVEIYSPVQLQGTNWHVCFQTPTEEMIKKFDITKEEVKEAVKSAFMPHQGSRRMIRYKMMQSGALNPVDKESMLMKLDLNDDVTIASKNQGKKEFSIMEADIV